MVLTATQQIGDGIVKETHYTLVRLFYTKTAAALPQKPTPTFKKKDLFILDHYFEF